VSLSLNKLRPEEVVRQKLLRYLTEELRFPASLISTEIAIGTLKRNSSNRRVDILCSVVDNDLIAPFLLIECKARKPTQKAFYQLAGYNTEIQAPYIAVVWESGMYCMKATPSGWQDCSKLPKYPSRMGVSKNSNCIYTQTS